jgi:alkylation response protein AidB-like acyl-CoA dehydrogenase
MGAGTAANGTDDSRDKDDYLITGSKMFITNGTWADIVLIFGRTGVLALVE